MTKSIKVTNFILLLMFLTPGFFALTHVLLVSAVPYIQQSLGVSVVATSYLISSFPLGISCGMLLFGHFVDQYGSKPTFFLGPVIVVTASLMSFFLSSSIELLTALHFFQAFGVAAIILSARVSLHRFAHRKTSKLAGYYSIEKMSCFSFDAVTPTVATAIVVICGWPNLFLVIIPLALGFVIAFHFASRNSISFDKPETEARKVKLEHLTKNRNFVNFTFLALANYAWIYFYYVSVPFLLVNVFQVEPLVYGLLLSLNLAVAVLAAFTNLTLVHIFSIRKVLLFGTLTTALASILLLCGTALAAASLPLFVILFLIMRFTTTITTVNTMTMAINSCRPGIAGKATALYCSCGYLTGFIVGVISGYVLDLPYSDLVSALVWLVIINFCAILLCQRAINEIDKETSELS